VCHSPSSGEPGDSSELIELLLARQRLKATLPPCPIQAVRRSIRSDECTAEDIGIEDDSHPPCGSNRSARTAASASSIAASMSAAEADALRALVLLSAHRQGDFRAISAQLARAIRVR